jgi:hypothetical protein
MAIAADYGQRYRAREHGRRLDFKTLFTHYLRSCHDRVPTGLVPPLVLGLSRREH